MFPFQDRVQVALQLVAHKLVCTNNCSLARKYDAMDRGAVGILVHGTRETPAGSLHRSGVSATETELIARTAPTGWTLFPSYSPCCWERSATPGASCYSVGIQLS